MAAALCAFLKPSQLTLKIALGQFQLIEELLELIFLHCRQYRSKLGPTKDSASERFKEPPNQATVSSSSRPCSGATLVVVSDAAPMMKPLSPIQFVAQNNCSQQLPGAHADRFYQVSQGLFDPGRTALDDGGGRTAWSNH
jgi:hypothetical protein